MRKDAAMAALVEPRRVAALTELVARAAAAIVAMCGSGLTARPKADLSPVTDADERSQAIILAGLAQLFPRLAVVSEESDDACRAGQDLGPAFLLVDPLDGTRELLAGRSEYTVNVALIAAGAPALGIVAAPALGLLWRGGCGLGAERLAIEMTSGTASAAAPIRVRPWSPQPIALISRSHLDPDTSEFIERLALVEPRACGSALKFCRLAEGQADIYPRLAPTSEWDVAAGHAVLAASGGVVCAPSGEPLGYGRVKDAFRIPAFVAFGDPTAAPRALRLMHER